MLYLRQFKKLKSLNVAGNPLCQVEMYQSYIVAHVPALRYLDWRRISDEMREAAAITYQDKLESLLVKEQEDETERAQAQATFLRELGLKEACVPQMTGAAFFDSMMDVEIRRLDPVPGVAEILAAFRQNVEQKIDGLAAFGLEQYRIRQAEQQEFFAAIHAVSQAAKKCLLCYLGAWVLLFFPRWSFVVYAHLHALSTGCRRGLHISSPAGGSLRKEQGECP